MVLNQPFHRTLKNLTDLNTCCLRSLLQNLLVTVSYGTNKMYRILLIIILHHVSAEKSDKALRTSSGDSFSID